MTSRNPVRLAPYPVRTPTLKKRKSMDMDGIIVGSHRDRMPQLAAGISDDEQNTICRSFFGPGFRAHFTGALVERKNEAAPWALENISCIGPRAGNIVRLNPAHDHSERGISPKVNGSARQPGSQPSGANRR